MPSPRSVTITSLPEIQSTESLAVPLQKDYHGPLVISSEQACIRPTSVDDLLRKLNGVLGTTYTLEQHSGLSDLLQPFLDKAYDFGLVYGYVRSRDIWTSNPVAGLQNLERKARLDADWRSTLFDNATNSIRVSVVPPRRLWDLYSNRVIPSYTVLPERRQYVLEVNRRDKKWHAVSHSWIATPQFIMTPINSSQWPVPVPEATTLERVRIELLNFGIEYAWVDVLCLRQVGPDENEIIRLDEWKVDVPTIGSMYLGKIVHYYSGLGRPFHIGDLYDNRHWLNRAWTLQEASGDPIVAGIAADSPFPPSSLSGDREVGESESSDEREFYQKMTSLLIGSKYTRRIYPMLDAMRGREATSEMDKIAGLASKLTLVGIPGYVEGQAVEDAWNALVLEMRPDFRGDLLFRFPQPGEGKYKWCPSWHQVKSANPLPYAKLEHKQLDPAGYGLYLDDLGRHHWYVSQLEIEDPDPPPPGADEVVEFDRDTEIFSHEGYRFDSCVLSGLDANYNPSSASRREGTLSFHTQKGVNVFKVFAPHLHPVPDGEYTLVSAERHMCWMVGRLTETGAIEKVSVLEMTIETAIEFEDTVGMYYIFDKHKITSIYI